MFHGFENILFDAYKPMWYWRNRNMEIVLSGKGFLHSSFPLSSYVINFHVSLTYLTLQFTSCYAVCYSVTSEYMCVYFFTVLLP